MAWRQFITKRFHSNVSFIMEHFDKWCEKLLKLIIYCISSLLSLSHLWFQIFIFNFNSLKSLIKKATAPEGWSWRNFHLNVYGFSEFSRLMKVGFRFMNIERLKNWTNNQEKLDLLGNTKKNIVETRNRLQFHYIYIFTTFKLNS